MANDVLEKKHADELSATRYALKKVYEIAVLAVGAVGGAVGGIFAAKTSDSTGLHNTLPFSNPEKTPFVKQLPKFLQKITKAQAIGAVIGGSVGVLTGGLLLGYERWRKEEAQKLAVNEMNEDMAKTIAIQPTNPELVQENKRLRGMLTEMEEKRAKRDAIIAQGPKSHMEHAAHAPTEQARA